MTKFIKIAMIAVAGLTLSACVDEDFSSDYGYNSGYYSSGSSYSSQTTPAGNGGYYSSGSSAPAQTAPAGGYSSSYTPPAAPQPPTVAPSAPSSGYSSGGSSTNTSGYGSSVSEQHATVESNEPVVHVKPRIGAVMPPRAASTSGGYTSGN